MSNWRYKFLYSSGCILELAKIVIISIIFGVLLHFFIVSILPISGSSMEPNFKSGEWVLLDKISYLTGDPGRGDVVALKFPGDQNEKYIKRIIGLPNEEVTIKDGKVYISGSQLQELYIPRDVKTIQGDSKKLGADEYYVIGDNRLNSSDSRYWGVAKKSDLIGKAKYIIFPLKKFRPIGKPVY